MSNIERLSFDVKIDHVWEEGIWTKKTTQERPYYGYMEKTAECKNCGLTKSKFRMKKHGKWHDYPWGDWNRGHVLYDFEPLCLGTKISKEIL